MRRRKKLKQLHLSKSLAKLVFSIGITTLKVTKDNMDESKEDNSSDGEAKESKEGGKTIAIKGMGILISNDTKPKANKTGMGDAN
jgi:hypothetical protein